jgi:peptidyl-prolyl cis-trans isomerase B (cyclophilin B)
MGGWPIVPSPPESARSPVPARTPRSRDREELRRSRLYTARQTVHTRQGTRRRRDNIVAAITFVLAVAVATLAQIGFFTVGPGKPVAAKPSASASPTPTPTASATAPPPSAAENRTWTGTLTLNSTKLGITLDGKKAPHAVANFVTLAKKGFYTGLTCHRLTTSATSKVLQCGDPKGDGTGGPGYEFGPVENAPKDDVYRSGVIAMARSASENSQGSQFFLVYGTSGFGPGNHYTVFGHVTSGLPALRSAITSKGVKGGGEDGAPAVATRITALTVK